MASSAAFSSSSSPWQDRLSEHCRLSKKPPPVYNISSDKRGGRTAWSATVTIDGRIIAARYWYDGQYINNAKEDAAEVALQQLRVIPSPTSPQLAMRQQQALAMAPK